MDTLELPRTTLVVVAFHKPRSIEALLDRLGNCESSLRDRLDVVVMNVEGDPAVSEVAGRLGARVVNLEDNRGYAAAANAGRRLAETEVVVFANDDISCDAPAVLSLAAVVARGEADVAVPKIIDRTGKPVRTIQAIPDAAGFLREWLALPDEPIPLIAGVLSVQKWRLPASREPVAAASAIMVATSAGLLGSHPLPEEYFMYFEESEWFWHLKEAGLRTLYCADVRVVHEGGRGLVSEFKSEALARNAIHFMKRRYGRAGAAALYPAVVAWQVRLVAMAATRRLFGRGSAATTKARLAGLRAAVAALREVFS